MTNIKKDLILTEDTTFNESITVEGDIKGYFNLKVVGNIKAKNIDAWNIDAWDIDAWDIICEKRIKKSNKAKTFSRIFIQNKSKLERKEQLKSSLKGKEKTE